MREGSRVFTFSRELPPAGKTAEEKKVRFEVPNPRDRKYEGYSVTTGPKPSILKGKKDDKENVKDKKLDEEFIHNLHQHIYYLEMQLKLLYHFFRCSETSHIGKTKKWSRKRAA